MINKALLCFLVVLLTSFNSSAYKSFNNTLSSSHPLSKHLAEVYKTKRDNKYDRYFGTIEIEFERDTNYQVINATLIQLAYPKYDSILYHALRNAKPQLLKGIDYMKPIIVRIDIGKRPKNISSDAARILYADGRHKKAIKVLRKIYDVNPYNSQFAYLLGRSLDYLNDPEGMDIIRKVAKWGDRDAINYVNEKYNESTEN